MVEYKPTNEPCCKDLYVCLLNKPKLSCVFVVCDFCCSSIATFESDHKHFNNYLFIDSIRTKKQVIR